VLEFRLADIGEGTSEAEVLRWLVAEGQEVAAFQPIVEVQTDKVTTELTAPVAGTVRQIVAREGDVVPVGSVLCVIEDGEARQDEEAKARRRVLASPAARRRAQELGVDIARISGSGPLGRVTLEDVERAAHTGVEGGTEAKTSPEVPSSRDEGLRGEAPPEAVRVPLRGIRRAMRRAMAESHRTIPQALHLDEVDVGELVALRETLNQLLAEEGEHLTFLPFFLKALARALRDHPRLNAHFDAERDELLLFSSVHVGVATDTPEGLLVPVIRQVEQKSMRVLMRELSEKRSRAQAQALTQDDVQGATITVTNHGALGGIWGAPIIPVPQVAIVGFGRIRDEAVVRAGSVVARPVLHFSIAFDHRVLDGGDVLRFSRQFARYLEAPSLLLAELS